MTTPQLQQQDDNISLPPHSTNPDEELPRVLQALQTVYNSSYNNNSTNNISSIFNRRDVADKYLTSFQRMPVAWVVCDRLLSSDCPAISTTTSGGVGGVEDSTLRTQRQFFAAQTLHTKCLSDVYQLPTESLPSLRDSLINHFINHASPTSSSSGSSKPLVTRLSMAISSLAVQMGWNTILTDITNNILMTHPELGPAILELFRSIPEEADSTRLILVNEDDIYNYRDMLRSSATVVIGLCEHAIESTTTNGQIQSSDVATTEAVLSCLQSWIRTVDIDPQLLQNTKLLPWIFDLLTDPNKGGYELAVDVIVEIFRAYPSNRRGVEGLVRTIIPNVMSLGENKSNNSQSSPFTTSIQNEDEDGMRGYTRIFTEMSESYLSLILSHEEMNQSSLVELVLTCSNINDKEISGITLHFWYRFVIGLEELEPFEFRQIKIDYFAPQLMRLLSICTRLLCYPQGVEDLSLDRLDDIEGIRLYFADTIEDCCRLLGGEAVLRATGDPLQDECHRVASLPPEKQLSDWHGIEAYLYAIQAVSLYVPPDDQRVLPFVMNLIPQLPSDVPLLRATACQTVGRYASFLKVQPQYLQPLLPYLAQGLSIPKCASAAAIAIREICERCTSSLDDSVLQLYDGIVTAREQHRNSAGGSSGEEFILDLKNELEVLEGVCKSVSSKLVTDPSIINHLIQPIINNLKAMALPESSPSPKQISAEVCRLTTLIQHLRLPKAGSQQQQQGMNQSEFIISLMRETWSLLDVVSQKHPRDFNCGEKLCRLYKHALRECGSVQFAPLLDSLVQQTVKNFSLSLLSPYLYLASVIVSEYGRNPAHSKLLYDMVANLSSTVFGALRTTEDFTANPDVVEELFFMAGRMVNYCPSPLVQSALLNSLLQCAAVCMKLHHRDANRGTLNFLENTVSYSLKLQSSNSLNANEQADIAALEKAILTEGQPLVINLAQALLGDLPAYRLDSKSGSIAGVLFFLNQLCPELLMQWIQPPLTTAPEHAKSAFLGTLHNRVARDEFNTSVRKFTTVCERSRKR